jgi:uncharacterized protein (DUF2141 family)
MTRTGPVNSAGAKIAAAIGLLAVTPLLTAASPANGELVIDVTNLRSTKGVVLACMTTNPKIFPKCRKDPNSYSAKVPASSASKLRFKNVKPGRYAIALLHDENSNGKADRALSMIPKEGFGFSRDAKVRMGPPSFKSAAFNYAGAGTTMTIKMRYML